MITPEQKAKEIIKKFIPHAQYWDCYNDELLDENHAKQCALIAVDELLNNFLSNRNKKYGKEKYFFWQQVKIEIQKL